MAEPATVWRVTTTFRDLGGTVREASTYHRTLEAAREHVHGQSSEVILSRLEELRGDRPLGDTLCATLGTAIEEESIVEARLLETWRPDPNK